MESIIYNQKGEKVGTIQLPERVFGAKWNADLVHQVVTSLQSNARMGTAHTKFRGEVRGGGKKPWRQKGTGRARHGSTRSPLWVGGGVTHGPRAEKNYTREISRKTAAQALAVALSRKWKDGEILFVDRFSFGAPKTAEAKKVLTALADKAGFGKLVSKKQNAAFVGLAEVGTPTHKSFRNFGNLAVGAWRNLNAESALRYGYIVIEQPEEAVKFFAGKFKK